MLFRILMEVSQKFTNKTSCHNRCSCASCDSSLGSELEAQWLFNTTKVRRGQGMCKLARSRLFATLSVLFVSGVYPPRTDIRSDSTIEFCPFAVHFCVSPKYGPASGQ